MYWTGKFSQVDVLEVINPLMEEADFIDGELMIAGNRVLINLNLSSKYCLHIYVHKITKLQKTNQRLGIIRLRDVAM